MAQFPDKVYLNGEIIPSEKAQVSVFDRGFIFGDGIYEAMAQINGAFFTRRHIWVGLQRDFQKSIFRMI